MKNKFLKLISGVALALTLCSCGPEAEIPADFEINCDIYFCKDEKLTEKIDKNEFVVGEYVYIGVEFTLKKVNDLPTQNLDFTVTFNYAEYHSSKEYIEGTFDHPKEQPSKGRDENGEYDIITLTNMTYPIKDNKVRDQKFCFKISGNQPCEFTSFEAKFTPQNSNHDIVKLNGSTDDNKMIKEYKFVERATENEK